MSNIKALEKMRELCADMKSMDFASVGCDAVLEIADEIEQEIAERYILGPLDTDGVPIRIGDTLEGAPGSKWDGERFEVGSIELTACGWEVCDVETCDSIAAGQTRHVKSRTIEDVLRDCCNEWNEHCGDDWESGVYAKYAEEIREMMA